MNKRLAVIKFKDGLRSYGYFLNYLWALMKILKSEILGFRKAIRASPQLNKGIQEKEKLCSQYQNRPMKSWVLVMSVPSHNRQCQGITKNWLENIVLVLFLEAGDLGSLHIGLYVDLWSRIVEERIHSVSLDSYTNLQHTKYEIFLSAF